MDTICHYRDVVAHGLCVVIGTVGMLFGGWDDSLGALVILMVVDFIMACRAAHKNREPGAPWFDADKARAGGDKALTYGLMLIALSAVDRGLGLGAVESILGKAASFRGLFFVYYLPVELSSVMKNAQLCRVKIPNPLIKALMSIGIEAQRGRRRKRGKRK